MGTLILILLLLAALTGVFWTVVKVTAITILSLVLTVVVLVAVAIWYVRRRWRRFVNDPRTQERLRGPAHSEGQRGRSAVPARGRKEPDEPLPGSGVPI
jgi:membrane protein implicated in regulation of membrane protease activity